MGWLCGWYLHKVQINRNEYIVHLSILYISVYIYKCKLSKHIRLCSLIIRPSIHPQRLQELDVSENQLSAEDPSGNLDPLRVPFEIRKDWSCLNKNWLIGKMFWWFLERMLFDAYGCTFCFFGFGLFILVCFRWSSDNLLEMLDEDFAECFNHMSWLTPGCSSCWFCKCFGQTNWC